MALPDDQKVIQVDMSGAPTIHMHQHCLRDRIDDDYGHMRTFDDEDEEED